MDKNHMNNPSSISKGKGTQLSRESLIEQIEKDANRYSELLEAVEVCPYEDVSEPPTILTVDNIAFGTRGNFSCIHGKPKARKTFFVSLLVSAVLDKYNKNSRFKTNVSDSMVLYFDTEQSIYHVSLLTKRIINLLGWKERVENFKCYSLRSCTPRDRIMLIQTAINLFENVSLVVIDGVADLITSYNDEEQASMICNKMMEWTSDNDLHIMTIMHQNKGNSDSKGHLGSYILQKAETVLSVQKEKDDKVSTAKSTHSRGVDIKPISFQIDENGLPSIIEDGIESKKRIQSPFDLEVITNQKLVTEIFEGKKELSREELLELIQFHLGKHTIKVGLNKCREWLIYFKEQKMVSQNKKRQYIKI